VQLRPRLREANQETTVSQRRVDGANDRTIRCDGGLPGVAPLVNLSGKLDAPETKANQLPGRMGRVPCLSSSHVFDEHSLEEHDMTAEYDPLEATRAQKIPWKTAAQWPQ